MVTNTTTMTTTATSPSRGARRLAVTPLKKPHSSRQETVKLATTEGPEFMQHLPLKQKYRQECHEGGGGEINYLLAFNVMLQTYQRHFGAITVEPWRRRRRRWWEEAEWQSGVPQTVFTLQPDMMTCAARQHTFKGMEENKAYVPVTMTTPSTLYAPHRHLVINSGSSLARSMMTTTSISLLQSHLLRQTPPLFINL